MRSMLMGYKGYLTRMAEGAKLDSTAHHAGRQLASGNHVALLQSHNACYSLVNGGAEHL